MSIDSSALRYPSIRLMREAACRRLPRPVFDFADGGAEDEATLRRNEAAFQRYAFLPRPLQGTATRDQSVALFGQTLSTPVIIGPTGLAGLFWPQGEIAAAQAATAASTVYCLSHGSVCSIEQLAAAHRGLRWMQVFIYRDRGFTRELTQRAHDAGCHALVLTIDNQLLGKRERDVANGFSIPPRFTLPQWLGMAAKWRWAWSMRHELRTLTFGNYVRAGSSESESLATLAGRMGSLLDPAMSWDDVAQLRAHWQGPLLLKGVLHPAEARQALALGVDGLVVSNHGGRQLDGASSSLEALPSIVDVVQGRVPVLMDGGIRRGADVVKAIVLGAHAVLIARPQLWGLAVAGQAGVAHVLEVYRSEIDRVMGLLGAQNLDVLRRLDLLVDQEEDALHLSIAAALARRELVTHPIRRDCMNYIDGFVAAVPTANKPVYQRHCQDMGAVFKEHGALAIVDGWGDDVPEGKLTSFTMAVKREPDETVVFGWIVWPSREVRDAAWTAVMADARMKDQAMPFEGKRMIYGGFQVIAQS